ncbi:MAG: hypothetical protein V8S24_00890 [Gordonibacter pamelaeae]
MATTGRPEKSSSPVRARAASRSKSSRSKAAMFSSAFSSAWPYRSQKLAVLASPVYGFSQASWARLS